MSAPKLYKHYEKLAEDFNVHHPGLCCPHANSVFMATTLNLGDKVVTKEHRDHKNLGNGLCAVVSLGNYDYKSGGHLVLHDLKLILEFPPGWVIFLPSACITHSNTGISDNEWRSSITYYTAGGLFRWAAYGFQSEKDLRKHNPEQLQKMTEEKENRWNYGVDLFSTSEKLKEDISTVLS